MRLDINSLPQLQAEATLLLFTLDSASTVPCMSSSVVINMFSTLLYIFFVVSTTSLAQNGYIVDTAQNITCKDPSSPELPCSNILDYNIPDYGNLPDLSFLPKFKKIIHNTSFPLGSSSKSLCKKAGTKYLCEAAHHFVVKTNMLKLM